MNGKIALISNTAWYLHNFRGALIRQLLAKGYAVTAIAPPDEYVPRLEELGASFRPIGIDSKGANPFSDFRFALALRGILASERPACLLTFTVKPNVYGAFAARSLDIPTIANVSGLGTAFIKRTWITSIVMALYRRALEKAASVFFQNADDLELFIKQGLVRREKARLLPGSGVDTARFAPSTPPKDSSARFRFLLLGRLLLDKGIGEFVEAARRVRSRWPHCEFAIMGFTGSDNRTSISLDRIGEWENEGLVKYIPPAIDVRPELAKADCVVLPSYREGTPRSLLEASSMGIPIIATDVPGCRQVIEDGVTGYLVQVRDSEDLANKMERMLLTSNEERIAMGRRGRQKMLRQFDEQIVINEYFRAVREFALR